MIFEGDELKCPYCSGELRYYDKVKRIVKRGNGKCSYCYLKRYRCIFCNRTHRQIPNYIFPYKQYDIEIIKGVIEGIITCETFGYDDYPCEATMTRWIDSQIFQLLL